MANAGTATTFHYLTLPCKPRTNASLFSLTYRAPHHLKYTPFTSLSSSSQISRRPHGFMPMTMRSFEKPIHKSVVCMARRYGSNTRKRVIKSRRRGGDPEKKKKRKRKSPGKKKDGFRIVRLVSVAGTGYVYAKRKSKSNKEKLQIKKYDPNEKRHVVFKETK